MAKYQKPGETLKDFLELKGDVKQVMQTVYKVQRKGKEFIPGKIDPDYDYSGNFMYTLTREGNRKEDNLFHRGSNTLHRYNDKGLVTEMSQYYNGKLYTTTEFIYNDKKYNTETISRKPDGELNYRVVNTFNELGQVLESIQYMFRNGKEEILSKTIHIYTEQVFKINNIAHKKCLLNERYKGDGSLETRTSYKYDEQGNILEQHTENFTPEGRKFGKRHAYKRNRQGDLIEHNQYRYDGSLEGTTIYTPRYDSDGKRISEYTEPEKDLYETETIDETDSHGNWLKKTSLYKNVPRIIFIRELVYEGEEKTLVHPLSNTEDMKDKTTKPKFDDSQMEEADVKWLAEAANASPDNFSALRYYVLRYKEFPSLMYYTGPYIEAMVLLSRLKDEHDAVEIHSYCVVGASGDERRQRYTLSFPGHNGYLLHAIGISYQSEEQFNVPPDMRNRDDDYYVHFSQFQFLRPAETSENRDQSFEDDIFELVNDCTLEKKPDKPVINIIEVKNGNFSVAEYPVHDNFIIKDLDVNYGHGFDKFHNDLMQRFNSSTKGLVLFHGLPGTGKTYYIRHLLRKMVANRKNVIYIPPNMVDHLVDPAFMTFLSGELKDWSEDGQTCVLLIEDAEPLLAKRQEGVRIQGVTNLLNMTDGLLNDMLNIQIICTFNVDLRKLDSALLRPGRLIARKEFKALSELDANLLAQRLGIKHHFKKPATLGEIYALQKNQNTLIHEVEPDKGASTNIDDLV